MCVGKVNAPRRMSHLLSEAFCQFVECNVAMMKMNPPLDGRRVIERIKIDDNLMQRALLRLSEKVNKRKAPTDEEP